MNITVWTKPKAVFTLVLGLVVLTSPEWFFGLFGLELSSDGSLVGRMYAAAFFLVGLGVWRIKGPENFTTGEALIAVFGDGVLFVILLIAQLAGQMNAFGWVFVAAAFLSSLGFFWCYLRIRGDAQQSALV